MKSKVEALQKGLNYLKKIQRPSGEFATYTSPQLDLTQATAYEKSVYITTFVSHALTHVPQHLLSNAALISTIQHQIKAFLNAEQEDNGVWHYEGRGVKRVPPDLDTICCAVAALKCLGQSPSLMFYPLLWQNEAAPGGPYYTWLGVNQNKNDLRSCEIGALVNANLLFCGSLLNTALIGTVNYLKEIIKTARYYAESLYCISPHFLIYALSRAYADGQATALAPVMPTLQSYILTQLLPPQNEPSAFNIACLSVALLNLKTTPNLLDPYLNHLLATQQPNGHWPAWAAYRSYGANYDGSPALTTALVLEALSKCVAQSYLV